MEVTAPRKRIGVDMTEGSLFKKLIIFAIPMILTNLVQQLYNTVDLIIIGQYVGSTGTVGVSTGGDIVNFLTNVCMGFAMAGQIYISQLVGARLFDKVSATIGTLLSFMTILSVIFAFISIIFCDPLLELLNCPQEALSQARGYMIVTSIGMPFIFGYNAICCCLRGMGESKKPLEFILIAAVSNIFMDLLLVVVFPLEALGTAIATVVAQMFSCIAALIYMYRNKERFDFGFKLADFRIRSEQLKILIKLGIPKALKMSLINVSQLYCSSQINTFGLAASATNSVGNKIIRFCNIVMNSIDQGASTAIGQNLGAGNQDRAKKAVYIALVFSAGLSLFNVLLSLTIPKQIFSIFNNDPDVIEMGVGFMRIMIIAFVLSAIMGPYQAVISGSGNANLEFIIGLLDGVILRIGISILFANVFNMGVWGYFYGNALARLAPAVISVYYFYSGAWKRRKLLISR